MVTREVLALYRAAWRDYRGYVAFSTGVFLLTAVLGALVAVAGVDFLALLGADDLGDVLPDIGQLSRFEIFLTILFNNSRAFVIFVLGAASLGAFTLLGLAFNGLLIGYVVALSAAERGVLFVLVAIGPHGIFELPALFVAAAIGFRLVVVTVLRLASPVFSMVDAPDWAPEPREAVMTRSEWKRTGLVALTAYVVLVVAAFVEAFVTSSLLEALFPG